MTTYTPAPWFVSGVRIKMDRSEWHGIARYDEANKRDETIACVGYDTRTGEGMADARLIAAAPDLLQALRSISAKARSLEEDRETHNRGFWKACADEADAAIAKAEGLS